MDKDENDNKKSLEKHDGKERRLRGRKDETRRKRL